MSIADKLTTIAENEQKVYDAGKKAEYDRFWDAVQNYGNRTNYNRGFCGMTWTDDNFKPKYDIRPNGQNSAYSLFGFAAITDLVELLEKQGIVLDTSKASGLFGEMFANSSVTRIPTLDLTNANISNGTTNMFANCNRLKTIDKIIMSENTITYSMFNGVTALENVIFEGVIGYTIDFKSVPLSKDSIISIVNALSATKTGQTLTLKKSAVNNAFSINVDDETTYPVGSEYHTLRHSKDNWTFSYI